MSIRLGIEDIIEFVGGIYGKAKWDLYHQADFFVLPTHSENFGYVIAESLACGVPVITTKGTPWEELETYHCGCWIDREHDALVKAMLYLISQSSLQLRNMGLNGRSLIERKYSTTIMVQSLLKQYKINITTT